MPTNQTDPFDLFLSATDIRFCYYNETEKILGSTYGMCILQDFEAMTPNTLVRKAANPVPNPFVNTHLVHASMCPVSPHAHTDTDTRALNTST